MAAVANYDATCRDSKTRLQCRPYIQGHAHSLEGPGPVPDMDPDGFHLLIACIIDSRRGRGIGNACSIRITLCISLIYGVLGQYGSSHLV